MECAHPSCSLVKNMANGTPWTDSSRELHGESPFGKVSTVLSLREFVWWSPIWNVLIPPALLSRIWQTGLLGQIPEGKELHGVHTALPSGIGLVVSIMECAHPSCSPVKDLTSGTPSIDFSRELDGGSPVGKVSRVLSLREFVLREVGGRLSEMSSTLALPLQHSHKRD